MEKQYEMLRKKMTRFNEWEVENRKGLTVEIRLKQFIDLYELGQSYPADILARAHADHLKGLIETHQRLHKIAESRFYP